MRILVGVAVLASLALVAPPAHADHDVKVVDPDWPDSPDTNWPPAAASAHENPPQDPGGLPNSICGVTGGVNIVPPYKPGGPQHNLNLEPPLAGLEDQILTTLGEPPAGHSADIITRNLWNNPSHSHYEFAGVVIACVGILPGGITALFDVTANGGNDGHYFNIYNFNPITGADGNCSIAIPLVNGKGDPKKSEDKNTGGTCIPPTVGDELHAKNDHHGSVNESAWSHSSGYAGSAGDIACGGPDPDPNNKGTITATDQLSGVVSNGWVKYVRLGPIVYAWGEFCDGHGGGFATALVFTPNPLEGQPVPPPLDAEFLLNGVAVLR